MRHRITAPSRRVSLIYYYSTASTSEARADGSALSRYDHA